MTETLGDQSHLIVAFKNRYCFEGFATPEQLIRRYAEETESSLNVDTDEGMAAAVAQLKKYVQTN